MVGISELQALRNATQMWVKLGVQITKGDYNKLPTHNILLAGSKATFLYGLHPDVCNATLYMSLPLLHPETLVNKCAQLKYSSLLSHFPPIYHES
jgi:hypothetical protein